MNALSTVFVFTLALSVAAALQTTEIMNGASVQFQLNNTNMCLGAITVFQQMQLLIGPCNTAHTTFYVPNGAPARHTNLMLSDGLISSAVPALCVNAGQALDGNTPVSFDVCRDQPHTRWQISGGTGTGPIVSKDATSKCLTASTQNQGDPVVFKTCDGGAGSQWTAIVVADVKNW